MPQSIGLISVIHFSSVFAESSGQFTFASVLAAIIIVAAATFFVISLGQIVVQIVCALRGAILPITLILVLFIVVLLIVTAPKPPDQETVRLQAQLAQQAELAQRQQEHIKDLAGIAAKEARVSMVLEVFYVLGLLAIGVMVPTLLFLKRRQVGGFVEDVAYNAFSVVKVIGVMLLTWTNPFYWVLAIIVSKKGGISYGKALFGPVERIVSDERTALRMRESGHQN